MSRIEVTKDGITNTIISSLEFAKTAFLVSDGYSHAEVVLETPTALEIAQSARDWRNAELKKTDYIVPLSDHPSRTATMTYRTTLRDWPAVDSDGKYTNSFPDTKPTVGE